MEIIKDQDEGEYVVYYPVLPGCITCDETIEEALKNAVDAKKAWLEAAIEDGIKIKRWAIIKPIFDMWTQVLRLAHLRTNCNKFKALFNFFVSDIYSNP